MDEAQMKRAWLWADAELNKYASLLMGLKTTLEEIAAKWPGHPVAEKANAALQKFADDIEKPNLMDVPAKGES